MSETISVQVEQNNEQVIQLYQRGRYQEAFDLAFQTYDLAQSSLDPHHPHLATTLSLLANLYAELGNYPAAEPLLQQVVERYQSLYGEQHAEYAQALNNLADLYRRTGHYDLALHYYTQALEIWQATLGEKHPDVAIGLNNLAVVYKALGRYDDAEPLYQQAIGIRRALSGENSAEYAQTLNNLAELYSARGQYLQAEPLYQKALEITRLTSGEHHPAFARSLNNLAGLHSELGKYAEAALLYQQALPIWRRAFGKEHPAYATTLTNLALTYKQQGKYPEARRRYQQALTIRKKVLGMKHPSTANSLHNLAALDEIEGNYARAKRLYNQALSLRKTALGEQHPLVATTLHNLAELYAILGKYPEAIRLYQQSIALRKAAFGEHHLILASSFNNLAGLYHKLGNDKEAMEMQQQALDLFKQTLGEDHPNYATHLHNLALLFMAQGRFTEAEYYYKRALALREATLGKQHPDLAASFHNLALVYQVQGNYVEAEHAYQQALALERVVLGEQHAEFAATLHNRASLYQLQGKYEEALPLYKQANTIWQDTLGRQHPYLITNLNNQAILSAAIGQDAQAMHQFQQAAELSNFVIGQVFSATSERQRMAYLTAIQNHYDTFLSFVLLHHASTPSLSQIGLDLALRRKALGAEALRIQRFTVLQGKYPALKKLLREVDTLQMQLASRILEGPGMGQDGAYQHDLTALQREIEQREMELAYQIPEMNLTRQLRSTNWQAIAQLLPPGTALIEFIRFERYDFHTHDAQGKTSWGPGQYGAFVIRAENNEEVMMFDLGAASDIDDLIANLRTTITHELEESGLRHITLETSQASPLKDCGVALRKHIFDPLLPALGPCRQFFLSPDGDLTRLPFEVLPGYESTVSHLLDTYQICYLNTGRDLLHSTMTETRQLTPPVVVADPDFDLADTLVDGEASAQLQATTLVHGLPLFTPLPGTHNEGKWIAKTFGARSFFGKKALEALIKGQRAPSLLHIATHGFFLPDRSQEHNQTQPLFVVSSAGKFEQLMNESPENPLLRSGLALAGANTWNRGGQLPPNAEDGILTAADVAGMDLSGTELVVLSACETGLGTVEYGEGVFGLRRAFTIAGAKRLVMSLWKVPDQQTQILMKDFYEAIQLGISCADALRQAQQKLKKAYPEPFYWGAFIHLGDPRAIHLPVANHPIGLPKEEDSGETNP